MQSAEQSCRELGCGKAVSELAQLSSADITWISCNDDVIHDLVNTIANTPFTKAW